MAVKNNKKKIKSTKPLPIDIIGVALLGIAIYLMWLLFRASQTVGGDLSQPLGFIGAFIYRSMDSLLGHGKLILPLLMFLQGIICFSHKMTLTQIQRIGIILASFLMLTFLHLGIVVQEHPIQLGWTGLGGGIIGGSLAWLLYKAFGQTGAYITASILFVITLLIISKGHLIKWCQKALNWLIMTIKRFGMACKGFIFVEINDTKTSNKEPKKKMKKTQSTVVEEKPIIINNLQEIQNDISQRKIAEANEEAKQQAAESATPIAEHAHGEQPEFAPIMDQKATYNFPEITFMEPLLNSQPSITQNEINEKVNLLQKTLNDFGVKGQISEVSVGPAITRYEFQPAAGVKVSKIVNLADDIALSLAAAGVRIEAPIPGKAAVGIEVPNKEISMVVMRDLLESSIFQESKSKLTVTLGKDISGQTIIADLSKMPHLLIAGSTGSGKSVCMNALIISILYKATPSEVKFLMVDPKMVELGNYNGIPHLISPVVTDPKKAASALRWAVHEMERRYELFAANGAKDIGRFNKLSEERLRQCADSDEKESIEVLPYIIILIDELADLMMVAPADVEDAICRLAQMARAAGMHLVVATQRPSVDVITGIIKANIPSRIAFAVSSQVDSRTILDMGGAEKLLGKGDMLFYPSGMPKPLRVQGVYVSDKEIDRVVEAIKEQGAPAYDESIGQAALDSEGGQQSANSTEEDELISEAAKLFIENGQASISLLQRRYRIGYNRAARIIDQMEQKGLVGPYEGSRPRQVKITMEEYCKMYES